MQTKEETQREKPGGTLYYSLKCSRRTAHQIKGQSKFEVGTEHTGSAAMLCRLFITPESSIGLTRGAAKSLRQLDNNVDGKPSEDCGGKRELSG